MAAANAPIAMREALTLTSLGIAPQFVTFTHVTMESDRYICVRETSPQNSLVIIDMTMPSQPLRRPITADSALMNPNTRILALRAQIPGTTQDHLQIFNIEAKTKVKNHQMPEQVVFWKWITPKLLGLVTRTIVYHWSIEGDSEPVKMFDRTANLANNQIINYRCDPAEKWLVLIGVSPGAPERPQLVKGNMQLFSVDQQRSQALEAHAASFATIKVPGNENPSTLICFASKATNAGQITSNLHVIELGAQPGKPGFSRKRADLLFPPDFQDDFPVAMQISQKYGLVYVITKLALLFVYDLETASTVYRNRISGDPIFLTAESSTTGGFYAINRKGQVLHATINDATIVPFISGQLNNLELSVNLAKRANLPGAENLMGSMLHNMTLHNMTLQQLKDITNNFCDERILGRGGYGVVYKGVLENRKVIAVKKLAQSKSISQDEFENEVKLLMKLKHPNIVQLVSYCYETQRLHQSHEGNFIFVEDTQCLLCLEYMSKGSLEKYISDASSGLDWPTRYKIIEGISYGLQYLHDQGVMHLDLKPGNILIDEDMSPKIADFGLSRPNDKNQTIRTKNVSGTLGYMPPEYLQGIITNMSDIFSLGVIIVEVIVGRRAYPEDSATSSTNFVELAIKNWREVLQKKPDYASLEKDCQQIKRCIQVGLICMNPQRAKRPTMKQIINILRGLESTSQHISNSYEATTSRAEP